MGDGIAIGIDLGTTHCSIAVFRNNKVELIPNEHGSRITPSCVAFTDKGMLIGETAENQAVRNYRNTVIDVKRLIGPKFDDISIQSDQKYWPFTVLSSDTGYPQVQVELKGVEGSFTPEEITTMILLKLKQTAEKFLGSRVTKAVVSVPAYFNEAQRRATKDAGAIAGLNVMKVVNGAALAATAYCFDKKRDGERNILVFDLGGGSLSVALVTFEEEIIQVKSVAGNNHLGGEDFTNRMVDHFVDEVKRKHNKDISADKRAMHRLRIVCERAKWNLSSSEQQSIEVDSLAKGIDFHSTITRRRFELLCANLFTASVEPVEKALRDAKLDKSAIHEVVLVGGSSRIPKIQQLLSSMFGGKMLNKGVNPDEAVAYGAAIQAAISSDVKSNLIKDLLFIDVTPISLGVETDGGVMTTIVNRNTTISTKASLTVPIRCDAESGWQIKIYEGEHAMTKDNNLIGKFGFRCTEHRKDSATGFLANIGLGGLMPRTQPNEHQIEVTFDIHADGTITVSAKDSKSKYDLKHTISCSRLTDWETRRIRDEISTMIANEDQPTNDEIADLHAEISQLKEQNSDLWQQLEAQKNQHNGKEVDDDEKRQLKDELEEVKRKYRKLLMMVGRQDTK